MLINMTVSKPIKITKQKRTHRIIPRSPPPDFYGNIPRKALVYMMPPKIYKARVIAPRYHRMYDKIDRVVDCRYNDEHQEWQWKCLEYQDNGSPKLYGWISQSTAIKLLHNNTKFEISFVGPPAIYNGQHGRWVKFKGFKDAPFVFVSNKDLKASK